MPIIDVEQLHGTLLGLHDLKGAFLALGIRQEFDPDHERLRVLSPLQDAGRVRTLASGSLCLKARGSERGEAAWR